jgi:glycosyltransferase involved in cell wall biosynthesis
MSVLSRLQSFGVTRSFSRINFRTKPASEPARVELRENPIVSCLMTTRGNIDLMRYSLACYRRQTYPHRELLVVAEPEAGEKVQAFFASEDALNVRVFVAPPGLTLGDHRNLAAARASGAVLVNWDDDDLSDPLRLAIAIRVLHEADAAAAFLSRLLIWWPQRKIAAISNRKTWEGSMAVRRTNMPIYGALPRGEDTAAIDWFVKTHRDRLAYIDCPLLYVYAVTGRNISGDSHFEEMLSIAECIFEGDEFDELNQLLSDRLPVLEYSEMLQCKGSCN